MPLNTFILDLGGAGGTLFITIKTYRYFESGGSIRFLIKSTSRVAKSHFLDGRKDSEQL